MTRPRPSTLDSTFFSRAARRRRDGVRWRRALRQREQQRHKTARRQRERVVPHPPPFRVPKDEDGRRGDNKGAQGRPRRAPRTRGVRHERHARRPHERPVGVGRAALEDAQRAAQVVGGGVVEVGEHGERGGRRVSRVGLDVDERRPLQARGREAAGAQRAECARAKVLLEARAKRQVRPRGALERDGVARVRHVEAHKDGHEGARQDGPACASEARDERAPFHAPSPSPSLYSGNAKGLPVRGRAFPWTLRGPPHEAARWIATSASGTRLEGSERVSGERGSDRAGTKIFRGNTAKECAHSV